MNVVTNAVDVPQLLDIAVRGLHCMFDPATGIFCDRLVSDTQGWKQKGTSPRYSLMSFLGLHQAEVAGICTGFDPADLTRRMASRLDWLTNLGDLGCLLWAVAEITPYDLARLWSQVQPTTALDRYADGQAGATMELAWFLTGLARANATDSKLTGIEGIAEMTYARLLQNRGQSGLFGHLSRQAGIHGRVRGHVGSFADQVYPTIAMSLVAQSFEINDALGYALTTARKVCSLQGPLGQWWWHYNSDRGTVVSTFPVYSVHQHAMGPMMLFSVMAASGEDFQSSISKGLQWIANNELGTDMREMTVPLVWRAIAQTKAGKWKTRFAATISPESALQRSPGKLSLVSECRPYELGWMLYAFSGRRNHPAFGTRTSHP
jgi:hypothetical protein